MPAPEAPSARRCRRGGRSVAVTLYRKLVVRLRFNVIVPVGPRDMPRTGPVSSLSRPISRWNGRISQTSASHDMVTENRGVISASLRAVFGPCCISRTPIGWPTSSSSIRRRRLWRKLNRASSNSRRRSTRLRLASKRQTPSSRWPRRTTTGRINCSRPRISRRPCSIPRNAISTPPTDRRRGSGRRATCKSGLHLRNWRDQHDGSLRRSWSATIFAQHAMSIENPADFAWGPWGGGTTR